MARAAVPAIALVDAGARAWVAKAVAAEGLCPLAESVELLVARADDGTPVGAIGLERYGDVGVLRSLVVDRVARGRGIGTALVRALEKTARQAGVETLYLLTETAEPFFAALGYAATARHEVPDAVAGNEEFRLYCPSSAACMRKRL